MLKLFLVICIILLPAIILMGHRIFFTKDKEFPSIHVDTNPEMRKRGIGCVQSQDRQSRKPNAHRIEMVKKD